MLSEPAVPMICHKSGLINCEAHATHPIHQTRVLVICSWMEKCTFMPGGRSTTAPSSPSNKATLQADMVSARRDTSIDSSLGVAQHD